MSRVIVTEGAVVGLEKCRSFLEEKNPLVARRAADIIHSQLSLLEQQPEIGRPDGDIPDLREWLIPFGDSGYVTLYRYDQTTDIVYVLAFRHQKEAGYLT